MTSQYGAPKGVDLAETLVHRRGPVRRRRAASAACDAMADSISAGPIDVSLETSASSPTTACAIRLRRRQPEAFVL
jgi:hypothetical protein